MCCKSGLPGSCYSLLSYSTLLESHAFEKGRGVCLISDSSSITCRFLFNRFKHLVNCLVSYCLSYSCLMVNSLVYFVDECSEVNQEPQSTCCCVKQTSFPQKIHQKETEPDHLVLNEGLFLKVKAHFCVHYPTTRLLKIEKETSGREGGQTGRTWSTWYQWVDFCEERMVWLCTAQGALFYA